VLARVISNSPEPTDQPLVLPRTSSFVISVKRDLSHYHTKGKTHSMLKGIFGSKREKVPGGWRNLHNEKLHNLYKYYSPEIGTSSIDWAQKSRFYLKTGTESSLRNVVF
jgi:hypothetical protein